MLAITTHYLTLLAFVAHVLLGCCCHHQHPRAGTGCAGHSGEGSQHASLPATSASGTCCHAAEPCQNDLGGVRPSVGLTQETPSHAPPPCGTSPCKYVASGSLVLPTVDWLCTPAIVPRMSTLDARRRTVRAGACEPTVISLTASRCALFQSWQI